jgi:hypothetical protein
MHPVLASDFTGLLELVIWFWVAAPYACLLAIAFVLSLFPRTWRPAMRLARFLMYCGLVFLPAVLLQLSPTLRGATPSHRDHSAEGLMLTGMVSGLLVLASYGLFCWCRYALKRWP